MIPRKTRDLALPRVFFSIAKPFSPCIARELILGLACIAAWLSALAAHAQNSATASEETAGVLWTGGPGITETVDQIMARQAAAPKRTDTNTDPTEPHPRHVPVRPQRPDPKAAALAHWPPSSVQAVDNTRRPRLPQIVSTSFLGAQLSDTPGFVPPD